MSNGEDLVGFYSEEGHIKRHLSEWKKIKEEVLELEKKPTILNSYQEFVKNETPYNTGYTEEEILNILRRFKKEVFTTEQLKEIMKTDIILYHYIINPSSVEIDPYIQLYLDKLKSETGSNVQKIFDNSKTVLEESKKSDDITKQQEAINTLNKTSFFKEDLMKDKNNNTVEKDNIAKNFKPIRMINKTESQKEFITKQIIRTFLPEASLGLYGLTEFTGVNITGKFLSNQPFIKPKEERELWWSNNLDNNFIVKVLPDVLLNLSKRIDYRPFNLIASASPFITTSVINTKERGNPFKFNSENNEMDILASLSTLLPFIKELFKPFMKNVFRVDSNSFTDPMNRYIEDLNSPHNDNKYNNINQQNFIPRSHIKQPNLNLFK